MTLVIVESKDWRGSGVRVPVFVRPEDLEEFQLFCLSGGQSIVAIKEGFTIEVEEREKVHVG